MSNLEIALAILSTTGFLIALPQIWGKSWKDFWQYYIRGTTLTWNEVGVAYDNVVNQMKEDSFTPTLIIGVGRGGAIGAGLVCSELVTNNLRENKEDVNSTPPIKIGIINSVIKKRKNREIDDIQFTPPTIEADSNEKILLIIGQSFSGESLRDARKMLEKYNLPEDSLKTATLFIYKKNSNIKHTPNYVGLTVHDHKTVPWKDVRKNTDR